MQSIGFVVSGKENERRRALLPADVGRVKRREFLVFEEDYATELGFPDSAYTELGCRVVPREQVYRCEIICNPKAPEPAERPLFQKGQTLFGWAHAVQGRSITDFLLERSMTAIAWEDMHQDGRHVFWRNNELAGEAAVLHAVSFLGRAPGGLRAALVGLGNCGRGAFRALSQLGMHVVTYNRTSSHLLAAEIGAYDLVVNATLWDIFRTDHLVTRADFKRMRPGSMIIDISCDEAMCIETSRPTPISDPIYKVDGITHYVVDHTPALFYRTATEEISRAVAPYLDELIEARLGECLRKALIIQNAKILDDRIIRFQRRQ
jgi:N5-(carboxyethyl)ornithine synthase